MIDAMNKFNSLWQKGYINQKLSHAITTDDSWDLFYSGKAAMKMEGSWALNAIIKQNPDFEWDMFMLPAWTEGVEANLPLALGDASGINARSKHPDEAAKFLDYLFSVEQAMTLLPTGSFYPLNGVDPSQVQDLDPHIIKSYNMLAEAMANEQTGYAAWTYWPPSVETYTWDNLDSVLLGQLSVEDYLLEAEKLSQQDKADGKWFEFAE